MLMGLSSAVKHLPQPRAELQTSPATSRLQGSLQEDLAQELKPNQHLARLLRPRS